MDYTSLLRNAGDKKSRVGIIGATKGYSLEGGGAEIATQQVKEKLRAVIAREDRDKPYSDQKLSEILSVMGIEISRRTVAKYRDELGIADCRARKFTPLS